MTYMVWSDSLEEMVPYGFSVKLKNGRYTHYTWSDEDCVYWNDEYEYYHMEIPVTAIKDTHR